MDSEAFIRLALFPAKELTEREMAQVNKLAKSASRVKNLFTLITTEIHPINAGLSFTLML